MAKVNRQAGIHLHKTEILKPAKKGKSKSDTYISKEYYWVLIAKNGKTIARSSETYKTRRAAVKSITIAGNLFDNSVTSVGWNFYDHSTGQVNEDFVEF